MQQHHLIGGIIAIAGVLDLVVLLTFILPRFKAPPQAKRLLASIIGGSGVTCVAVGAVISLLGASWFD